MSPDRIRHILKAITWRLVGTIDTVVLSWLITGNLELGLKIGTVWARLNVYGYSVEKALTPGWRSRNVCSI